MNRKINLYAMALSAAAGSLVALPAAATEGPYVGGLLGGNLASKQKYDWNGSQTGLLVPQQPAVVEDSQVPNSGDAVTRYKYKISPMFGFVGGYSFANGLRPEFELDFRSDKPKRIDFLTAGSNSAASNSTSHSSLNSTTAFANLWYDLFASSSIHPYLGGGVGVIQYTLSHFRENAVAATRHTDGTAASVVLPVIEDTRRSVDSQFAFQVGGGLRYDVTDSITVGIDYRYVKGGTGKFYVYRLQPETHFDADYSAQTVALNVDYYFFKKPAPVAPAAPTPVVAAPPPPDSDGDGVIDDLDKCPGTPAGTAVDDKGCPLPPPPPPCKSPALGEKVSLKGCGTGDIIVLRGVNFEFDKARLTPNAKVILDGVAEELIANPQINVELDGHTDAKGSDEYNEKLSEARATTVKAYLVKHGVDKGRMTSKGFGESQPVADNDTDEGRELNRRVELKITSGAAENISVEAANPNAPVPVPAAAAPAAEAAPAPVADAAAPAPAADAAAPAPAADAAAPAPAAEPNPFANATP